MLILYDQFDPLEAFAEKHLNIAQDAKKMGGVSIAQKAMNRVWAADRLHDLNTLRKNDPQRFARWKQSGLADLGKLYNSKDKKPLSDAAKYFSTTKDPEKKPFQRTVPVEIKPAPESGGTTSTKVFVKKS